MFQTFLNIFKVTELRNKVLFTLLMLGIYRIGFWIPLPGVDQESMAEKAQPGIKLVHQAERELKALKQDHAAAADIAAAQDKLDRANAEMHKHAGDTDTTAAGRIASYVSLFSGGSLGQSTLFGLGVMPYISASIIFQLLGTVVPALEKMQKEGDTGRKRIQEWTRWSAVPIAALQAIMWLSYMQHADMVNQHYQHLHGTAFWFTGVILLTTGCIFLMWLGEQIEEYGLGNGVSLIILAGIVARMPAAVQRLIAETNFSQHVDVTKNVSLGKIATLAGLFVFIIMGSILITQAQRRIPVQQAKHTRGRRVYGGGKQFLPLRVNHGGVMPIIFAQSLMLFPGALLGWLDSSVFVGKSRIAFLGFLNDQFRRGAFLYIITELAMIYFFAYFWTTVQFQPKEMANQLRDYGSFIPGLRPGKRTADYLEKVMMRITYVGAAFLCIVAVIPTVVTEWMSIDPMVSQFLGGTGLLIVVSVALDMVQRIEANLLMRNYGGFLGPGGRRIKGRQY
jgi:preprotein translocase subunit SecY